MSRVLVIGIGSLIMTDDGIGSRVIGVIHGKLHEHGYTAIIGETDVQYCVDEVRPDDLLIIIDAVIEGKDPGSISVIPLYEAAVSRLSPYSQHDYSLIDAVLTDYPNQRGYLVGIEAADIGFGFDLSVVLQDRFENICEMVFNAIIKIVEAENHA